MDVDVDLSGVLEQATLAHVGQKSEVEIVRRIQRIEAAFLFSSENTLVVLKSQVQCPMDEMSSRSEHRFTS